MFQPAQSCEIFSKVGTPKNVEGHDKQDYAKYSVYNHELNDDINW